MSIQTTIQQNNVVTTIKEKVLETTIGQRRIVSTITTGAVSLPWRFVSSYEELTSALENGGTVVLVAGTYTSTHGWGDGVSIENVDGLRVIGNGQPITKTAEASKPLIRLDSSENAIVWGIHTVGEGAAFKRPPANDGNSIAFLEGSNGGRVMYCTFEGGTATVIDAALNGQSVSGDDPLAGDLPLKQLVVGFCTFKDVKMGLIPMGSSDVLYVGNFHAFTRGGVKFDGEFRRDELPVPFDTPAGNSIAALNVVSWGTPGNAEDASNPTFAIAEGNHNTMILGNVAANQRGMPLMSVKYGQTHEDVRRTMVLGSISGHFHRAHVHRPQLNFLNSTYEHRLLLAINSGATVSSLSLGDDPDDYDIDTNTPAIQAKNSTVEQVIRTKYEKIDDSNGGVDGVQTTYNFTLAELPQVGSVKIHDGFEIWLDDGTPVANVCQLVGEFGSTGSYNTTTGAGSITTHADIDPPSELIWASYNVESGDSWKDGDKIALRQAGDATEYQEFTVNGDHAVGVGSIAVVPVPAHYTFPIGTLIRHKSATAQDIVFSHEIAGESSRGYHYLRHEAPDYLDGYHVTHQYYTDWGLLERGAEDDDIGSSDDNNARNAAICLEIYSRSRNVTLSHNILRLTRDNANYGLALRFVVLKGPEAVNTELNRPQITLTNEIYRDFTGAPGGLRSMLEVYNCDVVLQDCDFMNGRVRLFNSTLIVQGGRYENVTFRNEVDAGGTSTITLDGGRYIKGSDYTFLAANQNGGSIIVKGAPDLSSYSNPWNVGTGSITLDGLRVNNVTSATTLGTVTDKLEIFDVEGDSLGFIPVYDAIT